MKKRTLLLTALTVLTLAAMGGCGPASDGNTVTVPKQNSENQMEANSPSGTTTTQTGFDNGITEEEAKAIALSDAGVAEADLTNIRITQDVDDGTAVYDVEFYVGNKEYDYEIQAADGTIRSQDADIEQDFLNSTTNDTSSLISKEEASKIVLAKVEGATEQNLRIALDTENGQQVYEGEIRFQGMEYEFELNANTGDILEWSKEREDD